jgi:hypothetical protein
MHGQAKVTSLEALELFRSALIQFNSSTLGRLDEVGDEIRRTRAWIQFDRRPHWEGELRRRRRDLDQAEQELLSAKLSSLRDSVSLQKTAVLKARRAVSEAEEKLRAVKFWSRDFDHKVAPLLKQIEGLRLHLDLELPKGIAFLLRAQETLDAYASHQLSPSPSLPQKQPPPLAPPPPPLEHPSTP